MSATPEILTTVRALVDGIAGPSRRPSVIDEHTSLTESYWLDSVELFELVLACEETFAISFDAEEDLRPDRFRTLGTVASLVRQKLEPRTTS